MKTFEDFVKPQSGYMAYALSAASRADLLHRFPPKYSEVIAHHITLKFPAKSTDELPAVPHEAHVVGYEDSGDGLEALMVEINGSTKRPDGKLFHITLSLDSAKGKKPGHSNDLLAKGFKKVSPVAIHIEPKFFPHGSK